METWKSCQQHYYFFGFPVKCPCINNECSAQKIMRFLQLAGLLSPNPPLPSSYIYYHWGTKYMYMQYQENLIFLIENSYMSDLKLSLSFGFLKESLGSLAGLIMLGLQASSSRGKKEGKEPTSSLSVFVSLKSMLAGTSFGGYQLSWPPCLSSFTASRMYKNSRIQIKVPLF